MEDTEKNRDGDLDSHIGTLRNSIDKIDEEILDLINRRLLAAGEIGKVKKAKGNQILDRAHEDSIFQRLSAINKGPLGKNALNYIFGEIFSASREIQQSHRVTFLGPEATFTHIAAMKHFGHSALFVPQPSIRDIFREVEKETCHYGVVPVENSIEGSVNHTLDLLFESDLKICAEIYHPISHDLLSKNGNLNDIRVIYSHPQAFAQCREWLRKYLPEGKMEECSSTAYAARKSAEDPDSAAIASSEAARIYNLRVVAPRIEDFSQNVTRFLVIGRHDVPRTGNDKTSLVYAIAHVPGSLYRTLQPIAAAGINMLKLESRPTKHENWSYYFFMDIEGHREDPNVKDTLVVMKSMCQYLKCLGSYAKTHEG